MRRRWPFFALVCLALAGACATTRRGALRRLPVGPEIPVTVAVTETEASVTGTDPQSGERFEGTLHAMDTNGDRGLLGPSPPVGGGSMTPGQAPPPMGRTKQTIHMTGRLEGSLGTSLKCAVQIERTLTMRGSGTCFLADTDEAKPAYTLRF